MRLSVFGLVWLQFALGVFGSDDDGNNDDTTESSSTSTTSTTTNSSTFIAGESVSNSVSFAVNIPSAGSSDLYLQIQAPDSMTWVGFGQGSSMTGANMFIIYSNAAGTNVTLSARASFGDVEPTTASSSAVTLLAGSGITGGLMTANVLCTNCQSWSGGSMDFTSSSASFVWGYKSGSAIASDSTTASITEHNNYGELSFDLAAATGGSSSNPFLTYSGATSASGSGTSSGSGGGSNIIAQTHGSLGFLAFAIFFPLGVIVLRIFSFRGLLWVHVAIQMLAYAVALAVLGTGAYLATTQKTLLAAHPIIGFVVIGLLFLQPGLGFAHHIMYKRTGGSSVFTLPHIFWGRLWITVGIINGGLGLRMSNEDNDLIIAYSVVAGVMWLLWIASVLFAARRKSRRNIRGSIRLNGDQRNEELEMQKSNRAVEIGAAR